MNSFSCILTHTTNSIFINYYSTSKCPKTHYDVLNLPRNCTVKEIKESFIKLSKQNHPDVNKNIDAHSKFLAINESYKVLSNSGSRRNYDLGLIPNRTDVNYCDLHEYSRNRNESYRDPTFYANRDRSKDNLYMGKPYYGIKGQEKVSNLKVVAVCLTLATFAVGLQVLAIMKSVTFQREQLLKKSKEAQVSLAELKKTVELNGNQVQIELLKLKLSEQEKRQGRKS